MDLAGMSRAFTAVLGVILLAFLASCAHWADRAEVRPAKEAVVFEGIEFRINSREIRYTGVQAAGRTVAPEKAFVIIELTLKNSYSSPVPPQFQPRFALVDPRGREHGPRADLASSAAGQPGAASALSPQTVYTKRLIFDVPEDDYRLRVFTPVIVKPGPQGSVQGRYFYYDLGAGR